MNLIYLVIAASIVTVPSNDKPLDNSPITVYDIQSGGVEILIPYAPGHYTSVPLKKPPTGESIQLKQHEQRRK
jgi:hypothetical protein